MGDIFFKIWYMIAVLPYIILLEGSKKFESFLKKKNIYLHWDVFHSFIVVLIILLIVLWVNGFRW